MVGDGRIKSLACCLARSFSYCWISYTSDPAPLTCPATTLRSFRGSTLFAEISLEVTNPSMGGKLPEVGGRPLPDVSGLVLPLVVGRTVLPAVYGLEASG